MLPKELKPKHLYNLLRLGRNNDGGYLVEKNSLEVSILILAKSTPTQVQPFSKNGNNTPPSAHPTSMTVVPFSIAHVFSKKGNT